MGDLIGFPRGPRLPPPRDVWDPRTRKFDEQYALEVLKKRLPPEALRHVAGLDLASIAAAVLLEVDVARDKRRFDLRYDEGRAGGELKALQEMFSGPIRTDEPEPPVSA